MYITYGTINSSAINRTALDENKNLYKAYRVYFPYFSHIFTYMLIMQNNLLVYFVGYWFIINGRICCVYTSLEYYKIP